MLPTGRPKLTIPDILAREYVAHQRKMILSGLRNLFQTHDCFVRRIMNAERL
jgi:hypothetical protein